MNITLSEFRSFLSRRFILVLMAGLAIRFLFITLHQRPLISDEKDYDQLAYHLVKTGMYEVDGKPTAYRPVGYPAFVAAIYFAAGHSPQIIKYIQAILDCLTALLLFLLLVPTGRSVAYGAAVLWLFFPSAIIFSNFLLSETLFTFLLLLLVFLLKSLDRATHVQSILCGVVLGALILIKSFMLIFVLVLPGLFWVNNFSFRFVKWILIGTLLATGPWTVRNALVIGSPTLATNGGINLLIGNNPSATGAYHSNVPPELMDTSGNEVLADRQALRHAIKYITENPGPFAINGMKKLAHLFSSQGGILVWSFSENPENAFTGYAEKYRSIPMILSALVNLPFVVIMILGCFGFFLVPRNIVWWTFVVLAGMWIAVHVLFFGGSRFLFPLLPFFVIFAVFVLSDFPASVRRLSIVELALAGVVAVGLLTIWTVELVTVMLA